MWNENWRAWPSYWHVHQTTRQTANIHADSEPKAGAVNQMWSRLQLSLSAPPAAMERSCSLGLRSIRTTSDICSTRDTSISSSCEVLQGGGFLLLGTLLRENSSRESTEVGAEGILGWGVALKNISSLQVFNIIQKREAKYVFTGCEHSSAFLNQMSIPQGTGLLLRFAWYQFKIDFYKSHFRLVSTDEYLCQ